MATNPKLQGLPSPTLPLVDKNGNINPVWFQFLNSVTQVLLGGAITPTSVASSGPVSGTDATFTGAVEFGTYTAGTFNQTGSVSIKDDLGITRRLMVG